MTFPILDPRIDTYLKELASVHDEPVLLEMEQLAEENGFPIVGRLSGMFLETIALSIGARTVFEMGSGYGYSAYWFTRAVGPEGKVWCTDGDPANRDLAEGYLTRAGRWNQVDYTVGYAQKVLDATEGTFDIVYNDVDKEQYPDAWLQAKERVRPGGIYICDNVLWSGRAVGGAEDDGSESTAAIRQQNQMIFDDPDFNAFIHPVRDGLIFARKKTD